MSSDLYNELLNTWDQKIRDGQSNSVKKELHQLNFKKIPRNLLVRFAHIARRVGQPHTIIVLLNHVIRSEKPSLIQATSEEKAIYGLGLLRLGAFNEAEKILNSVNPQEDPQVYFYMASLYINQWNYSKALPLLRHYIKNKKVNAYQKLVGRLNLCAALVSLKKNQAAAKHIERLMKHLHVKKHQLLLGNLYEVNAQLNFNLENFKQVESDLEKSTGLLQLADPGHLLMIQKWKILTQIKTTKQPEKSIAKLQALKSEALQFKEWELIRDCDLHLATFQKNQDLLLQVYWGTLYKQFKKRIISLGLEKKYIQDFYFWQYGQSDYNIDIQNLAPTDLLKAVFYYLTRDFYRPIRAIELFSLVYQNEFYNPVTSPKKLQTLIKRARHWLLTNKIPLEIKNYRNEYKLLATEPLRLKVHAVVHAVNTPKKNRPLDRFKKQLFTAKDYADFFQISQRTAQREIQSHLKHQRMKSIGHSVAKKYRLI